MRLRGTVRKYSDLESKDVVKINTVRKFFEQFVFVSNKTQRAMQLATQTSAFVIALENIFDEKYFSET